MRQTYLCLAFILSHVLAIGGDECNVMGRLEEMMRTLAQAVGNSVNSATGKLSQKLDDINKAVENQKLTFEDFKKSLNTRDEVRRIINSIDLKQLKDRNSTATSLESRSGKLSDIKNFTTLRFPMVDEGLARISEVTRSLGHLSGKVETLKERSSEQGTKFDSVNDSLKQTTESIAQLIANNTENVKNLQKEILKALAERSKPFSTVALSHMNKLAAIANSTAGEINKFVDLGPNLQHIYRLAEDLQRNHPNNDVVYSVAVSLEALKDSAQSTISSVSKNVGELIRTLKEMKALSDNNCPDDLSLEIRNHHNQALKYFNDTIAGSDDKQVRLWDEAMKKFEDIGKSSEASGDIAGKLTKLRQDIDDIRNFLEARLKDSESTDDMEIG